MSYIPLKLDACIRNLYTNLVTNSEVSKGSFMGGSRKKFRGGGGGRTKHSGHKSCSVKCFT